MVRAPRNASLGTGFKGVANAGPSHAGMVVHRIGMGTAEGRVADGAHIRPASCRRLSRRGCRRRESDRVAWRSWPRPGSVGFLSMVRITSDLLPRGKPAALGRKWAASSALVIRPSGAPAVVGLADVVRSWAFAVAGRPRGHPRPAWRARPMLASEQSRADHRRSRRRRRRAIFWQPTQFAFSYTRRPRSGAWGMHRADRHAQSGQQGDHGENSEAIRAAVIRGTSRCLPPF